jgi:hypothetical protein
VEVDLVLVVPVVRHAFPRWRLAGRPF